MAINTGFGGVSRPVEEEVGILWYAEATQKDTLLNDALTALNVEDIAGLTEAGAVSTDGFTVESEDGDSGDDEILKDWSGNEFDRIPSDDGAEGGSTISFSLLEVLNVDAMKLVYKNVVAQTGANGMISEINGTQKPTDKFIVFEYSIKGHIVREVFPECSFASRESFSLANSELSSHGVTYNVKGKDSENYYKRVFPTTDPIDDPEEA